MQTRTVAFVGLLSSTFCIAVLAGQADTPDAHVARAKIAAGDAYQNLFNFLCAAPAERGCATARLLRIN